MKDLLIAGLKEIFDKYDLYHKTVGTEESIAENYIPGSDIFEVRGYINDIKYGGRLYLPIDAPDEYKLLQINILLDQLSNKVKESLGLHKS